MKQLQIEVSNQPIFLVWGTPDKGPRSIALAKKLGIDLHFVHTGLPRGALYALIKYPIQTVKTLWLLMQTRPRVIFVQNPPPIAVICVRLYCTLAKARYVIDAHSGAFSNQRWVSPPLGIKKWLSRGAITTIVTNEHWKEIVNQWGGNAIVIRDIPATFPSDGEYPVRGNFKVAFVNTFSEDEPLGNFLEAACALPEVQFYVTGRIRPKDEAIVSSAAPNVHFTNFLSDKTYYALLRSADAVICLTTRDYTMQRGACEALSLCKPIITSDWDVLRQYFHRGTVYVDNTVGGIQQGISQMLTEYRKYSIGIQELHVEQQNEWEQKSNTLLSLIRESGH